MTSIRTICRIGPVIPVIVIDDLGLAVPLAETLAEAGLRVLEVTLRTPVAIKAIEAMATAVPGAVVGAGTIRSAADIRAAREAGAAFGVRPGTTPAPRDAIRAGGLPFLPGCGSASEAMVLAEAGFDTVKLFPAEAVGGANLLKSLASPCPTSPSARPAGFLLPMRRPTCHSPMSPAWAARGWCRRKPSPPVTGPASARWRRRPPAWAARRADRICDPPLSGLY